MRKKGQKCVSKARVETDNDEKGENVCPRREWRQIMRKKVKNVCPRQEWRQIMRGKRSKMCVRGESGDT